MTAPDEAAWAAVVRAAPLTPARAISVAAVIALVTRGRNLRTALLLKDMGQLGNVQHNAGFMLTSKMATR
jgi:hypothetical protein